MKITETERLLLRQLTLEDAPFIFEQLNDPAWVRYIGDKGIKTMDDARHYIQQGPLEMYDRLGFGLFQVVLKQGLQPIGLCGFIKRDWMDDVDIGFAFLPQYWGNGYAFESASAVMAYGKRALGLSRIAAITDEDNDSSSKLLERLGFKFERLMRYQNSDEMVKFYTITV